MHTQTTRRVRIVDPPSDPLWGEFVQSSPEAAIFHHPAWLALLNEQYGFKATAICVQRNGVVVAGIPFFEVKGLTSRKRLVCLPFSDHCAPLSSTDADLRFLLEHVRSEGTRNGFFVQIRACTDPSLGFVMGPSQWLHVTPIDGDAGALLKSFKARVQRPIKKAKAQGLTTEIRQDPEAIDIFWRLHLATRKRQGVPIQPRGYFSLFHKHIIARNLGFVALTRSDGQYVCGGIFCTFNGVITYKYGASDPEYRHFSPTYLMFWETMLFAREAGLSRFDFGRTEVSNAGLRQFKSGWNSRETALRYSYFPAVPSGRLFEMMNTRIVKPVIRRSPSFVCQAAGELLYRYFGA